MLSFSFHALFGRDKEYSLQQVKFFSLQRVGSGWEALVIDTCLCRELVYHFCEIVFSYREFVFHPSERSLPCDFWMCYVIIEMLS